MEHSCKPDNSLSPEQISKGLNSRWLGKTIQFHQELDSTNETAFDLARRGACEGTVVLAEHQLRGRGRQRRLWHSPAGVGIYCSLILRPELPAARTQLVTLMAAVALTRTVVATVALSPRLKWPNDVLIAEKKVAGILTETQSSQGLIKFAVVGIGVNVNHRAADFPAELQATATSLRLEAGKPVERAALIRRLFVELENHYEILRREGQKNILDHWRQLSATLGRRVRVLLPGKAIEGIALDLDDDGALLVQTLESSMTVVHAGEVEHLAEI